MPLKTYLVHCYDKEFNTHDSCTAVVLENLSGLDNLKEIEKIAKDKLGEDITVLGVSDLGYKL